MSKLLILGAGGHGKAVADAAMATGSWSGIAFLDSNKNLKEVLGFPIVGGIDDYTLFLERFPAAFVAIGHNKTRLLWLEKLEQAGFQIPTIIHPASTISRFSSIGSGSIVMAGVVVNAATTIGEGCILNTSSSIDHDCVVEKGVHISPGVNVSGTVSIKSYTWLGVGAKVSNNITIGSNVTVAAGAVVINNVSDHVMVAGVPAKIKKDFGDER
ncbi:hypothetical protein A8L34_21330 [Bacillus sp. FJAT-27264]|uniref:acetyltransferase n=1 Tax=Paenibacillus sp. (strain DSM 101736 / FJAT-27264) TaxID=1850362 RepID=UPI000807DC78|nr:acetyltransferase [Bacillus sp. FJAT-27264]OBZ09889.1 hypothetical protein A8L34_21330 [Bacillus sp. FJAT-27264]